MAAGGVLVGRGYVSIRPEFEGDWDRSVNSRASGAGRSGASAFTKAFGIGLKGIGALAGVAIGANLASTAAGASALAPALVTAGAAAGALKIGLSGVGDAMKAAFADSTADASAAASATKAVETAQRGLANAQRSLADAQVEAAKRVKTAQQQVADAERDLTDAQRDARDAQRDLNGARQEAARALEDMNTQLAQSRLDEKEAALQLAQAEEDLKAAQAKPGTDPKDLEELEIRYERAQLALKEQQTQTKRLAEDTKKADKAGVEGSDQVLAAKKKISDANETVADKERALAQAQAGVDEARVDGQRQIADAQQAVADAASAVADAQAAAAAQTSALDQAMAKLAPNARSFVSAVMGLGPAWTSMKLGVQNALFEGLDSTVTQLGRATIPVLARQLTATAGVWNAIAKNAAGAVTEMAKSGALDKILQGATDNLKIFEKTPAQILTAFGQLTLAAQPAFNALLTRFAGTITQFTDGIAASFQSGGLETAINTAFGILAQFGTLLGNVLGTVLSIVKAASDAGGQIVGVMGAVFGELNQLLAAPAMQAQLRTLFASVAQIVTAIVPVIGTVVQAAVPLVTAIIQPLAQLAVLLGPVLLQLVGTLGVALLPIVQALGPVLVTVGAALVQLVSSVTPLLQPIANLITSVITALAPALTPIVGVITAVVGVLVGPLTQVVVALTPALTQVGTVIAAVFQMMAPLWQQFAGVLGEVAGLVANVFVAALTQLMGAVQPLIPVGMQLVQTVFGALAPVLPIVAGAFGTIAEAGSLLLPLLGRLVGTLAAQFIPVVGVIVKVLGQVAGLLAGALAKILPPLSSAFLTLVMAVSPLLPVIGQLVGMVVQMAAGVLVQLMPAVVQLVGAGLDLVIALAPLLPIVAQLIGLVVQLAVGVLARLLPPIVSLAAFLVGGLASALSTVIGWVAGLVNVFADVVSWVTVRLGPVFTWLSDKVITPVWAVIKWEIKTAWALTINPVLMAFKAAVAALGPVFTWLRDKIVKPVMGDLVTTIKYGYDKGIKPVLSALTTALGLVGDGFKAAVTASKTQWDKLKTISKTPVAFVINTVYNAGIVALWNKIATAFGSPKLPEFHPKGFASGGILPGYTPGTDVHRFISPTGGMLDLSGGESIMRPEFTRGAGSGFVNYFNRVARSSGAAGVRKALAPVLGGNPRTTAVDRSLTYARGGIYPHQAFADGGVFGWIKSAGSSLLGAGSKAWNAVKKSASWLGDTLEASARAGVKKLVDPLLKDFPGMDTALGQMIRKVPDKIVGALTGYSKVADSKGAGGVGGPRIQAGLKWARTQNGLPYQWGGNGNPSWDCSGLVSAVESVVRGEKPHRRWATGAFHGTTAPPGWVLHGNSAYRIGVTNKGVGHTAGTIGGVNIESRGGDGVVIGRGARGYKDRLFSDWYGFQPGKHDSGGWMEPGWAYNGLKTPEAVFTPAQFRAFEGAANAGMAAAQGGSNQYVINARTADFTVADLERVQRVQEARARVGRPR
ncbi:hypothetical protein JHN63_01840 [Streptomyces sp. MBT65]|uniref:hypothetical protein n=1 Tax=Streptomyces sp. MBT65 TaxID=1488395 RepID=UPI00190C3170|nr:hypothetical protein [Streptomyces sp. MBT65]MBK3572583.1 hypothetical protein [Streptomyces sp. MBT65]